MFNLKDSVNSQEFHLGNGEIRSLIKNTDWSLKPIGSADQWPRSLKNMIAMILDNGLPMYISWGSENIQFYNDAFLPILGLEKHPAALGGTTRETFSEAWDVIEPMFKAVMNGKAIFKEDYLFPLFRNGRFENCYFNLSHGPIRDDNGNIAGIVTIFHDVTEEVLIKNKIKESESRYRLLANSIPHLIWTSAPDGSVNYGNQSFQQYTGINTENLDNSSWIKTIHPLDLPSVLRAWLLSMKTGISFKKEYRIRRSDGEYRWFLGRAVAIKNENGDILYWNGTGTIIEDYKRIQRELETAKEIAEAANATKSAFLANMSHEIRTPLTAILGFSNLLKNSDLDELTRASFIETICRNGQNLTGIIDDILDIAKVEAGKLNIENVDFSLINLLSEIINLFSLKSSRKNIYLTLNIDDNVPDNIHSDPSRLRQILINIVGNALKFTDIGGVTINVKALNEIDGSFDLFFEVKDTGCGLNEEQVKTIFEPFMQADNSTTRKFGGTGLGLSISKRLSEALGGTISVAKMNIENGSIFTIKVKVIRALNEIKKIKVLLDNSKDESLLLAGKNILFADDCTDNRFLIQHYLTSRGANVCLANDGREAVDKALSRKYDLVLMDIQMPKMDGCEAYKILKNRGYQTPVIAFTAHAMDEQVKATRALGFSGHLTKPFNFPELLETIVSLTN